MFKLIFPLYYLHQRSHEFLGPLHTFFYYMYIVTNANKSKKNHQINAGIFKFFFTFSEVYIDLIFDVISNF